MKSIENNLRDLVCQWDRAIVEIEAVIKVICDADMTDNEKLHKIANVVLSVDITLQANRDKLELIRKDLRET